MPRPMVLAAARWRVLAGAAALIIVALAGLAPAGTAGNAAATKPEPQYAGADTCIACHSEVPDHLDKDWHGARVAHQPGTRNCEECHGPSQVHADDPTEVRTTTNVTRARADKSGAACLRCHEGQPRLQGWARSDHARADVACWKCHSAGSKAHVTTTRKPDKQVCYGCHREQQASFELTSHHPVREGRLDCSDCHDPHGRHRPGADSTRQCGACHRAQAGPFVFAHGSMTSALSEGCLDCHAAHGSPNGRLLKYTGRGLCMQCHADKALHFVGRTCWTSGCHAQVHGSNLHPLLLGP